MHVLFMPLEHCEKKRRLVWRSTIDKRGRELYDGFFSTVGKRHGLDKPITLTSAAKAALALTLIDTLHRSGDGATSSRAWEAVKVAIKANPKPFAVQLGINLKAFVLCKNPLGSFEAASSTAISKLPHCVRSFQSIDLETGELKGIEGAENNFEVNVKSMIDLTRTMWAITPCASQRHTSQPRSNKRNREGDKRAASALARQVIGRHDATRLELLALAQTKRGVYLKTIKQNQSTESRVTV
jgi:hypothetical protein